MARRRLETHLFDLVSVLAEATDDDERIVRFVAELIRDGRALDSRGIALKLSVALGRTGTGASLPCPADGPASRRLCADPVRQPRNP